MLMTAEFLAAEQKNATRLKDSWITTDSARENPVPCVPVLLRCTIIMPNSVPKTQDVGTSFARMLSINRSIFSLMMNTLRMTIDSVLLKKNKLSKQSALLSTAMGC